MIKFAKKSIHHIIIIFDRFKGIVGEEKWLRILFAVQSQDISATASSKSLSA